MTGMCRCAWVLMLAGLGGCASLDQGNGEFGAHTGIYQVRAATYNALRDHAVAHCPNGYQVIDIEHSGAFDWEASIRCKGLQP